MKKCYLAILLLSSLVVVSCTAAVEPIKIGFIGPLTGGGALWGEGTRNMVALAAEEINMRGGVGGRPLEVIYEDDKLDAKEAINAAHKLIFIDKAKIIIGGHSSPETIAIMPLTADNKIIVLAGVTSANNAVDASPYAFRTSPPTRDIAAEIANIAITNYKKVSILTEQAAFSKSMSDDFRTSFTSLGGTILNEEKYEPGHTDFKTALLKIDKADPDALFISPQNPDSAILILRQLRELRITTPIFGNSILVAKDVFTKSGEGFDSRAYSVIPFTNIHQPKARELAQKYKEKFGSDVPYNFFYVAASYDAVYIITEALTACQEDADCIKHFLRRVTYNGAASSFRFKENGDPYFTSWGMVRIINREEVITPLP